MKTFLIVLITALLSMTTTWLITPVIGGMGKPFKIVHDGQQIKFCCKNCVPEFAKDPEKYLSKLK